MPGILRAIAAFATKAAKTAANKVGQFVRKRAEEYAEKQVKKATRVQRWAEQKQRNQIEKQLEEQFRSTAPRKEDRVYVTLNGDQFDELYRQQSEATKRRTSIFKQNLSKMGLPQNILDDLQSLSNAQFYALNEFLDLGNLIDVMYVTSQSTMDTKAKNFEMGTQAQSVEFLLNNYKRMFSEGVGA